MCHILEFQPFQLHLKLLLASIPSSDFHCCPNQLRQDSLIYAFLFLKQFLANGELRLRVTKESATQ